VNFYTEPKKYDFSCEFCIVHDEQNCPSNIKLYSEACLTLRDEYSKIHIDKQEIKEGTKYDEGKPRPALVLGEFIKPLMEVVKVGTDGAKVHGENNWKLVPSWKYKEALLRHIMSWLNNESHAEDTGSHHLAHAAWNCLALLWFELKEQ